MGDADYWKDYSFFIKKTEELVNCSPSDLIEKYKLLIEELESNKLLEWIYEENERPNTIQKINLILTDPSLEKNKVKKDFEETIWKLDIRFLPYLKIDPSNKNWRQNFQLTEIDWDKKAN